jgi:hypothetical protein
VVGSICIKRSQCYARPVAGVVTGRCSVCACSTGSERGTESRRLGFGRRASRGSRSTARGGGSEHIHGCMRALRLRVTSKHGSFPSFPMICRSLRPWSASASTRPPTRRTSAWGARCSHALCLCTTQRLCIKAQSVATWSWGRYHSCHHELHHGRKRCLAGSLQLAITWDLGLWMMFFQHYSRTV